MLSNSDKLLCSLLIVSKRAFERALLLCVDTQDGTLDSDGIVFLDLKCM